MVIYTKEYRFLDLSFVSNNERYTLYILYRWGKEKGTLSGNKWPCTHQREAALPTKAISSRTRQLPRPFFARLIYTLDPGPRPMIYINGGNCPSKGIRFGVVGGEDECDWGHTKEFITGPLMISAHCMA